MLGPKSLTFWLLVLCLSEGVTTGCFFPISHSVLLPWIQTSLPKSLKLLSIRIKELFYLIVLQRKSQCVFVFSRAFCRETPLSNTRWFYGKKKTQTSKRKIEKGKLHLTENCFSIGPRNEMSRAVIIYSYIPHICVKGFLESNFN